MLTQRDTDACAVTHVHIDKYWPFISPCYMQRDAKVQYSYTVNLIECWQ